MTSDTITRLAPPAWEPYRPRRTWSLGTRKAEGWTLKLYGITASGVELGDSVVEAAVDHVISHLPSPPGHWAQGFVTIHAGEEAVWLLADLWFDDILHQLLFRAPASSPEVYEEAAPRRILACVWELEVLHHERDAWVRHVLLKPERPDLEAYLADRLSIAPPPD